MVFEPTSTSSSTSSRSSARRRRSGDARAHARQPARLGLPVGGSDRRRGPGLPLLAVRHRHGRHLGVGHARHRLRAYLAFGGRPARRSSAPACTGASSTSSRRSSCTSSIPRADELHRAPPRARSRRASSSTTTCGRSSPESMSERLGAAEHDGAMKSVTLAIAGLVAALTAGCASTASSGDLGPATAEGDQAGRSRWRRSTGSTSRGRWRSCPDSGDLLITERTGTLHLRDGETGERVEVTGTPEVVDAGQGGLGDVLPGPDVRRGRAGLPELGRGGRRGSRRRRGPRPARRPRGRRRASRTSRSSGGRRPKVAGEGHFSHRLAFSTRRASTSSCRPGAAARRRRRRTPPTRWARSCG